MPLRLSEHLRDGARTYRSTSRRFKVARLLMVLSSISPLFILWAIQGGKPFDWSTLDLAISRTRPLRGPSWPSLRVVRKTTQHGE